MTVIVIKNPVEHKLDTTNLPSTKRRDGTHGYGLTSMKNIAAKYDGEVVLTCDEQTFQTTILLKNPAEE